MEEEATAENHLSEDFQCQKLEEPGSLHIFLLLNFTELRSVVPADAVAVFSRVPSIRTWEHPGSVQTS